MTLPTLQKATALLLVQRIETVLPFWKCLGLTPTVEVPDDAFDDGRLAFVIFATHGGEIMYQTMTSFRADVVKSAARRELFAGEPQQAYLYVEVASVAAVESALDQSSLVMPRRQTAYGAIEVAYTDPAGNVIMFAQQRSD